MYKIFLFSEVSKHFQIHSKCDKKFGAPTLENWSAWKYVNCIANRILLNLDKHSLTSTALYKEY